jgi:microsomal dipeptidase-like Zn-dependent dipeptidase
MPFIDLHAHFPMHSPFPPMPFADPADNWKKPLFDVANAVLNYKGSQPRVSLQRWFEDDARSSVSGFGSVLHDPEDEFLVTTGPEPIPDAIRHIRAQWRNVETELANDGRVSVARNPEQVIDYLEHDRKFIFHTLEGGFSLGGDPCNVRALAELGVASIVPAHLLYRGVATCENGFPPAAHLLFKHELDHQPAIGLSPLGCAIVEECFRQRVIVDVTHARDKAQHEIFDIAAGYPGQPVISSHNAVRAIRPDGLNLSDEAIIRIKETDGVIGVIFYTHWLRRKRLDFRSDFTLLTDVIDHVHGITHSHDYVAIGSDLDGFIDPIHMCSNYSKMSALVGPLIHKYGESDAAKILHLNVRRVLQCGWKGVTVVPDVDADGNVQVNDGLR